MIHRFMSVITVLSLCLIPSRAQVTPDWENPLVFNLNKEAPQPLESFDLKYKILPCHQYDPAGPGKNQLLLGHCY